MSPERLHKIIARSGLASRRQAERWIIEGRVTVNGSTVREAGCRAEPGRDKIKVDGRLIPGVGRYGYYLMHKPPGLITSVGDPEGRPNLKDQLKKMGLGIRLFPVGRLDYNSSGLLLLTNDGELAFRVSHPKYEIGKVYRVKVNGWPSEADLQRLSGGIRLADGKTAPAGVRVVSKLRKKSWLEVQIHEGKYREVRRMMEALGYSVARLVRTEMGPLRLGALPVGALRSLMPGEISALRRSVGLGTEGPSRGEGSRRGRAWRDKDQAPMPS